jgi:hypothetical protein
LHHSHFLLRQIIPKIAEIYDKEINPTIETPVLLTLMRKTRVVDEGTGPLEEVTTVYRDTMCFPSTDSARRDSSRDISTNSSPRSARTRPEQSSTIDLNPTAAVLFAGTTKTTHQIPGYRGHVPRNMASQRKREHAFGKNLHPTKNDLILTQKQSTLGYTGQLLVNCLFTM